MYQREISCCSHCNFIDWKHTIHKCKGKSKAYSPQYFKPLFWSYHASRYVLIPMLIGPLYTRSTVGSLLTGNFNGKMIVLGSLWDTEA